MCSEPPLRSWVASPAGAARASILTLQAVRSGPERLTAMSEAKPDQAPAEVRDRIKSWARCRSATCWSWCWQSTISLPCSCVVALPMRTENSEPVGRGGTIAPARHDLPPQCLRKSHYQGANTPVPRTLSGKRTCCSKRPSRSAAQARPAARGAADECLAEHSRGGQSPSVQRTC